MTREEAIEKFESKLAEMESFIRLAAHPEEAYPDSIKLCEAMKIAIAALREQVSLEKKASDEKQATSGWISVEERLPEEADRVLVHLGGDKPPIGKLRMDTDRVVDGRWVRWFDLVTHWMPLPEPPEVEA